MPPSGLPLCPSAQARGLTAGYGASTNFVRVPLWVINRRALGPAAWPHHIQHRTSRHEILIRALGKEFGIDGARQSTLPGG